jgi:AcrR family transcriptional regulator
LDRKFATSIAIDIESQKNAHPLITNTMSISAISKVRGRPRTFDRAKAVETAMNLFWRHGYDATSIGMLTTELVITPPSLYAAFGSKAMLFYEAVEHYALGPGNGPSAALSREGSAREAVELFLQCASDELVRENLPSGCMVVVAAVNCGDPDVHSFMQGRRALMQRKIRACVERGIETGELPVETASSALASFYMSVFQGMSQQARDGASRESLRATARCAMLAWPTSEPG